MTLFSSPEEHAANPPGTWEVHKVTERLWKLRTAAGTDLDSFTTRKAAEAGKAFGWLVNMYVTDGRWYAGHTPTGQRSWAECKAEQEQRRARAELRLVEGYAAKFVAETAGSEPPRHVEPTDEVFAAMFANCVRVPPVDMYDEIRAAIPALSRARHDRPAPPHVSAWGESDSWSA